MDDRKQALEWFMKREKETSMPGARKMYREAIKALSEPERPTGRMTNKEWIDFLVAQFDISRTSARDMLHVMMQVKREDNFKKQFG